MNDKKIRYTTMLVISLISILVSVVLILDNNAPDEYTYLFLLPISYFINCMIFFKLWTCSLWNIGSWLIIFLYFMRNVMAPFFLMLGNYSSFFYNNSLNNINKALALMIYETIIVFFVMSLASKNGYKIKKNNDKEIRQINLIYYIIFLLAIFCIISYLLMPEIRLNFNTIFDSSVIEDNYSKSIVNVSNGFKRIVFSLTLFLIPILQNCLTIVIFIKFRTKFGERKISVVFSLIIIFLNFLMISGNNIDVFINALILSIILIKLYPKYEKLIIRFVGTGIIIGILVIVFAKSNTAFFGDSNRLASWSKTIQAYFQGVGNIAGGFRISNPSKISTLFFDFFDMIPFRNTLFNGLNIKGERLALVYCKSNNVSAQIIPCISQAYHYLGFIFAPIVPAILAYCAIKFQKRYRSEQNILKYSYYLFLIIYLGLAIAINNFTIFGTYFLNLILPIYILSKFTGKNCNFDTVKQ